MIADRNLQPGTQLIAKYKGAEHRALVGPAGGIVLEDHRTASSVSQAASLITGTSVNGWKFWTVAGAAPVVSPPEQTEAPTPPSPARPHRGGQATWWCLSCQAENNEPFRTCHKCGTPNGADVPVVVDETPAPRAKRRSRRDAHRAELAAPAIAGPTNGHAPATTVLRGQGYASANICSECGGILMPKGGEYHERTWPEGPVCCACRAKINGRPCAMMEAR